MEDLHHYPLVLPEAGTTLRQLFDLSCRMAGTFLEPAFSSNNFAALYGFTRHTPDALTVCSHFSVLWRAKQDGMTLKTINNSSLSQRTLQIQVPGANIARRRSIPFSTSPPGSWTKNISSGWRN
jgi:hypothetical protein